MKKSLAVSAALMELALGLATSGPAAAQEGAAATDAAARFGARAGIQQMSLSPNGSKIAFIAPLADRATALFIVAADGSGKP